MTEQTLAWLQEEGRGTFFDYIGGRLTAVSDRRLEGEVTIEAHHLNHMGITHGGVYAAMLDHVMGYAAYHLRPKARGVTTNLSIHYDAPIRLAGRMKVSGEIVHATRQTITTKGSIYDEQGELLALATAAYRAKEG